ncbi:MULTISPECIES: class I tRNA ligase family protein [Acinetobacter calcoaceticus/baumannii complex]|uniref:class I tRNA ligase family protein n=1 Tax=Acinetobacter calcoaceticus/baumannii complex TaxID=909768 RepID=UPI00119F3402|nr:MULTISPECIES: class I tRNA ligase family protein [Acinetobacter calcoaceticus/baumannii complex]MBD0476732.1 class I tRNA ligase family protein [Acinetobacter baumannii]MCP9174355.1 class I tRNA ligase family protein [Acinetobacter baumannii]MCZ2937051.1 class I tRNA ligase family protein [Acinetobacter baumannii]MDQ8923215.1 class I tRNA ligase family protein [Acinetobacter baumannii]MDQ8926612.1 class I tRNA ligase family protein [Acinetobacter baumannii]
MKLLNSISQSTQIFYGLECATLLEAINSEKIPFGSAICKVNPKQNSQLHRHNEKECFYIISGQGLIKCNDELSPINKDDLLIFDQFDLHSIYNESDEPLEFISIWWNDIENLIKQPIKNNNGTTLIFTAPPTPNGNLHLGHLSGPYSGADIFKRGLLLEGKIAFHSCGRDDNQTYVLKKAFDENRSPKDLADDYSNQILETLQKSNICIDHFENPLTSSTHNVITLEIFTTLYNKGFIYSKSTDALFCKSTGRYLFEAHVRGNCPHCNEESDGNACEQCGNPNDVSDLINPRSKYGTGEVTIKKIERLYFKLSHFENDLKEFVTQATMPAHLRSLCNEMLEKGLPDICVSNPTDWGIPVPIKGFENQKIYVWFEMAAGYLSSIAAFNKHNSENWQEFMHNSDNQYVHFFGFDNGYFHALLIPAIFMAIDSKINLPSAFVVNELLNLNGLKFSTSRGHLIWASDLLEQVPSDFLRFYLAYIRPESKKENFTLAEFQNFVDKEVEGKLFDTIQQIIKLIDNDFEGKVPESGAWSIEQISFYKKLNYSMKNLRECYLIENFSPQNAAYLILEINRLVKNFLDSQLFFKNQKSSYDYYRTTISLAYASLKIIAIGIFPLMPNFSEHLYSYLGNENPMLWDDEIILNSCDKVLKNKPSFSSFNSLYVSNILESV